MPRRPKIQKSQIIISVNGTPISVTMFPPAGTKRSWYAYWSGLKARKSTGQTVFEKAVVAVNDMLNHGGERRVLADAVLSDDEFEQIQRRHFGKKTSPEAKERAAKSLKATLEAISAFREISGLNPVTIATPQDCENFQHEALRRQRFWRKNYPKSKIDSSTLSANTVVKWSRSLQAAFQRANDNGGKKCVRGIVSDEKLLKSNPWLRFTWVEGFQRPIRQFDSEELLSILDYLEETCPSVTVAHSMCKVFLWSWSRKHEVASLQWSSYRRVGDEHHFVVVGKWGVVKWFRLPEEVFQELDALKTDSPFVFAVFSNQLRKHHAASVQPWQASQVRRDFDPHNLGEWFYRQVSSWSESLVRGKANVHVFRKTSLQYARRGNDANAQLAQDARVGTGVMMSSYVQETDEEMRHSSSRMFVRIQSSLREDVARRYGFERSASDRLASRLAEAIAAKNWRLVKKLSSKLARKAEGQSDTAQRQIKLRRHVPI